ncbi:MAG: YqgE/AlgH family protein [Leptospiraceae bacterium]|nr:YqgE/AlgH family protein [Leptospiraceae bacterium]MDW7976661.1 YqgE/AlgH family protein [Leptospiraceae bacterium]
MKQFGDFHSLKGNFLISETTMLDPNFKNTVVLMIEHNEDGAFGLIVNRKSNLTLADILPEFQSQRRGSETPIYIGGPVQQEFLFAIHSPLYDRSISTTAIEVIKGVYFEPGFRNLEQYFKDDYWKDLPLDDKPKIRLYIGYSGWSPGQLEREIQEGSWILHPASTKIIFHPNPEEGWKDALRQKGGIYKIFADTNQDPFMN